MLKLGQVEKAPEPLQCEAREGGGIGPQRACTSVLLLDQLSPGREACVVLLVVHDIHRCLDEDDREPSTC